MRHALEWLYRASGAVAAACIVAICLLVSAQILLNIIARVMGPGWSWTIPSYADFAGYMLANASFLALACTLREGGHIRVTLLTRRLPLRGAWMTEITALGLGLGLSLYALRYLVALVAESLRYGDKSTGIVAIPLWIPQTGVTIGIGVLCLALAHTLYDALRTRKPQLVDAEKPDLCPTH
ncbi:TRAP transporter small permease [Qingshengfaniella alkalisoli]|uniref:TRAP transporter small permease protein n=1 Tax=Qingshengfaniella alkalisoli TaxID=2599296 RepID=A0A5B8I9D5_9RHOB|nr:TRAP transporter small permease [Qingshengfaniella alkalisoli]QDY70865.1 TRAP transporter small permease [Qingshengfaniella alkalisoli]